MSGIKRHSPTHHPNGFATLISCGRQEVDFVELGNSHEEVYSSVVEGSEAATKKYFPRFSTI